MAVPIRVRSVGRRSPLKFALDTPASQEEVELFLCTALFSLLLLFFVFVLTL